MSSGDTSGSSSIHCIGCPLRHCLAGISTMLAAALCLWFLSDPLAVLQAPQQKQQQQTLHLPLPLHPVPIHHPTATFLGVKLTAAGYTAQGCSWNFLQPL